MWTSDITYLATEQGWLYLCAVRDGCSRRVIGYAFSDSLHTDVVETALRRAVTFREGETTGVIFHADRGCQYTSTQLADAAQELGVLLSVGRTGVCWGNAQVESFWSTLKTEFYDRHSFATRVETIQAVSSWIETIYNRRRRHSALGQPPNVRAPDHHRGLRSRLTDVHQTGSTPAEVPRLLRQGGVSSEWRRGGSSHRQGLRHGCWSRNQTNRSCSSLARARQAVQGPA